MQHNRPLRSARPRAVHVLIAAAWASAAAAGCSSEHRLGAVPADFGSESDEASGQSGQDFEVGPALGMPEVSMDTETGLSRPGYSNVAGIGDVDGDGFADFASIGEGGEHTFEFVHVRYGGPRPQGFDDTFALTEGGVRLGLSGYPPIEAIVPAGDVDADGYADFLVGLGRCSPFRETEGAFLVYGSPARPESAASLPDVGIHLQRPFAARQASDPPVCGSYRTIRSQFAKLGDFDGDGFDDILFSDSPDSDGFAAYLLYGRAERFANGTSWESADARFTSESNIGIEPVGDVNADGKADVVLERRLTPTSSEFFWLPGRAQRVTGGAALAALATPFVAARPAGDLDGDGVSDILLYDGWAPHLFYGAPGLFDATVDLGQAAATFEPHAGFVPASLLAVNDRDGDGDDELVSRFYAEDDYFRRERTHPPEIDRAWRHEVALVSGSSSRRSGRVQLPAPSTPYDNPGPRALEMVYSVGDLDGDGAGEVVTESS
jgi:hypothetical protein